MPQGFPTGVVIPVRVPSMGQIDLLKNYLYLIEPCGEKTLKKQLHKNINRNIQRTQFPNHCAENNPRLVDTPLKSIIQSINKRGV